MLNHTALYQRHVALGARVVEFAGWELPVQYPAGPLAEHRAVRQAAGLFDIDHMGQFEVAGRDALAYLQSVLTADLSSLAPGSARYALLCYADGGTADDVFLYALPGRYLMVVNAANRAKDLAWLRAHLPGQDVILRDVSDATYMLALQGPLAEAILQPLCSAPLAELARYHSQQAQIVDAPTLIGRTGYTGEDGFELYFAVEAAGSIWDALLAQGQPWGLLPCGLAARDSLRFEAGMPLYGHELMSDRSPLSAGLGWTVAWDKGAFLGRDALLKEHLEGSRERLVGLKLLERGVPRQGCRVLANGKPCGTVSSGMYAPTLDAFLALAFISTEHAASGTELGVEIRNKPHCALIVKKPFYRRGS